MARRLLEHGPREPKRRVEGVDVGDLRSSFFPNEVARALSIERIDYAQLRRFYRLIRNPSGSAELDVALGRGWARFSFTDMACLVVAIDCCGGPPALAPGRHLTIVGLREACASLYRQGFPVPLLNVGLERIGRRIVAEVNGVLVDPISGQLAIEAVAERVSSSGYFSRSLVRDPRLAEALQAEIARFRSSQ